MKDRVRGCTLRAKVLPLLATATIAAAIGCASSVETTKEKREERAESGGEPLEKYERLFNPSNYNPSPEIIDSLVKADTVGKGDGEKALDTLPPEAIPGFRIQVVSTTEIDTANALRNRLSDLPENVGIYVTYDSPYYKVRIGDFLSRPEANQLLKAITDRGYSEAWIVADRVLKKAPPRKPNPPEVKPSEP